MYDELVKALRGPYDSRNDICLMKQAADAIEKLGNWWKMYGALAEMVQMPKWIPVEERLPEVFQHVLANIPGMSPHPTVQEAFREKNGMWYSNGFRYGADEITHWMPLPEPPKEEAQ